MDCLPGALIFSVNDVLSLDNDSLCYRVTKSCYRDPSSDIEPGMQSLINPGPADQQPNDIYQRKKCVTKKGKHKRKCCAGMLAWIGIIREACGIQVRTKLTWPWDGYNPFQQYRYRCCSHNVDDQKL